MQWPNNGDNPLTPQHQHEHNMNKITEIIELDPRKLDLERLPIERCVLSDQADFLNKVKDEPLNPLVGVRYYIHFKRLMFIDRNGTAYSRCAEVIERYPRQVPEGVPSLPDDKPFLAFLGYSKNFPRLPNDSCNKYYTCEKTGEAIGWNTRIRGGDNELNPIAIDVSDPWTKEHYPEFVETMGYEPICDPDGVLIGHKLDGKSYDLEWKLVEPESQSLFATPDQISNTEIGEINKWLQDNYNANLDILPTRSWTRQDLISIPRALLVMLLNQTIPEVEDQKSDTSARVKFSDHSAEYGPPNFLSGPARDFSIFMAGEKRGEWEATNWKYETAEELYHSSVTRDIRLPVPEEFETLFNLIRETKDSE